MSLDEFKSGFPTNIISKIESFIFCGHLGDPIYATELLEIVDYIKSNSTSRILITTNGSYKKAEWWQHLGSMLDHNDQVTFSVDGWNNDSNNQYRVNSDFDSIVLGVKSLRASSECLIQWSTIYFAFNQDKINDIKALAKSLGCDRFQTVKSSKFDGRYLTDGVDVLKPTNDHVSETLLYDTTVEDFKTTKYAAVPVPVPVPVTPHKWARCLNYKKELFIGVDGVVSPCPWFNGRYQDNDFIQENRDQLSIRYRSFFEIINDVALWKKLVDRFDTDPLEICQLKCKNGQQ